MAEYVKVVKYLIDKRVPFGQGVGPQRGAVVYIDKYGKAQIVAAQSGMRISQDADKHNKKFGTELSVKVIRGDADWKAFVESVTPDAKPELPELVDGVISEPDKRDPLEDLKERMEAENSRPNDVAYATGLPRATVKSFLLGEEIADTDLKKILDFLYGNPKDF